MWDNLVREDGVPRIRIRGPWASLATQNKRKCVMSKLDDELTKHNNWNYPPSKIAKPSAWSIIWISHLWTRSLHSQEPSDNSCTYQKFFQFPFSKFYLTWISCQTKSALFSSPSRLLVDGHAKTLAKLKAQYLIFFFLNKNLFLKFLKPFSSSTSLSKTSQERKREKEREREMSFVVRRFTQLPLTLYRIQPQLPVSLREFASQKEKGRTSFDLITHNGLVLPAGTRCCRRERKGREKERGKERGSIMMEDFLARSPLLTSLLSSSLFSGRLLHWTQWHVAAAIRTQYALHPHCLQRWERQICLREREREGEREGERESTVHAC